MVWLKEWHRTFLCGDPRAASDFARSFHDPGRFGAWYVRNQHVGLVNQPAIRALASLHREMHERAYALAQVGLSQRVMPRAEYETFVETAAAFVVQVRRVEKAFAKASSDLDPLTGLRNRQTMLRDLERERARALRGNRPCCIALADLDHFKSVNDTYGHGVGDRVLAATGETFVAALRPYDTVYRYGGEEFLVCLPETGVHIALKVLERLLRELRARPISIGGGRKLSTTCSFGVAEMNADIPMEDTIKRADQALYLAKSGGRNRVCVWDETLIKKPPAQPRRLPGG